MVIKTATNQKRPSLPSKRPFGTLYQIAKTGLQYTGYYDEYNLQRYDPEYLYEKHVGKYAYKPRKRITGALQKTKGFLHATGNKFNKKSSYNKRWCNFNNKQYSYC